MQTTPNTTTNNSQNSSPNNSSTSQSIPKVNYLLTAQEAQKIRALVVKEIRKFQERIIQLETENHLLKQQLGMPVDKYSNTEEHTQPNPIVG